MEPPQPPPLRPPHPPRHSADAVLAGATLATTPPFSLAGRVTWAKVIACFDGDTFTAALPLFGEVFAFSCRLHGCDTPEMHPPRTVPEPQRAALKARAVLAKQALLSCLCSGVPAPPLQPLQPLQPQQPQQPLQPQQLGASHAASGGLSSAALDARVAANSRLVRLRCGEFDKYGRLLVRVGGAGGEEGEEECEDATDYMVRGGFAVAYSGGARV